MQGVGVKMPILECRLAPVAFSATRLERCQIWIVSRVTVLKYLHHEIQKHWHASARGLSDRRWPFRVRLTSRPMDFPVVHCGTGRRRLYSNREITRPGRFLTKRFGRLSEQFQHLRGQFRANPGSFMFEVDENVVPATVLLPNEFHPAFDVDPRIIFATQSKISIVRCRDF